MTLAPVPFFVSEHGAYRPTAVARGPWGPGTVNGRLIGGLAAHLLERRGNRSDMRPARFHVDLVRLATMEPLEAEASTVHDGRRMQVLNAVLLQAGRVVARASCTLVRPDEDPDGRVWSAGTQLAPPAERVGAVPDGSMALVQGNATGAVSRDFGTWSEPAARFAWIREVRGLVDDEPLTPLGRCVLAADVISPMLNWSDQGLRFINADYSLNLARLPVGDLIGLAGLERMSSEGIAAAAATLHDEQGAFAVGAATSLVQATGFQLQPPGTG